MLPAVPIPLLTLQAPGTMSTAEDAAWLSWVTERFQSIAGQGEEIGLEEFKAALQVKEVGAGPCIDLHSSVGLSTAGSGSSLCSMGSGLCRASQSCPSTSILCSPSLLSVSSRCLTWMAVVPSAWGSCTAP